MTTGFAKHIDAHFPQLRTGRSILAISGGIDSIVLAHLLHGAQVSFVMAHCNFNLRGAQSDGDETFVKTLGKQWGMEVFVQGFDTTAYAEENKVSIQMAARALRYEWFEQLRKQLGHDFILTAHHANDNLETFLINLSRGAGLDGLTGIPEQNGHILRPLMPFGRDDIEAYAKNHGARLATVTGRYYAMDRDNRWERVALAYNAMVKGEGTKTEDPVAAIKASYEDGVTDEFLKPIIVTEDDKPVATVQEGDVVLFFNFRTDRGRELTHMLSQEDNIQEGTKKLDLYYVTMTTYDATFKNVHVVYEEDNLKNTLGEVVSAAGKKQIRIAETEKYPHVTFFFSGGREEPFTGEKRIIAKSPHVATYDLKPEMSAYEVRDKIVSELKTEDADFVCLNFANPDMVGHTGVIEAAIKACETVDSCAKDVITTGLEHGYSTIVIADHGNCETMRNPDGSPNTAHTTNPVPIILVDPDRKKVNNGILGDIAPTILKMMQVDQPEEMDQHPLV